MNWRNALVSEQQRKCDQFKSPFVASPPNLKIGISLSARQGLVPINGLRHPPVADTTGWYIWGGEELSGDDDFFKPLCAEHLEDWCPSVLPYLGLAPGWRFLIADGHEDVWYDETLLASDDHA